MGLLSYFWRSRLWDEIDRLDDKVDFLLRKIKTLEAKIEKHDIK